MVGRVPQSPFIIVTLAGMLAFRGILIGITNARLFPPPAPRCHKLGKAIYLQHRLHHWRAWLNGFCWLAMAGRMRRQALGLQSPASTAVVVARL